MSNKFVIGGGSSLIGVNTRQLHKYGHVIGVNDAALWTNVHAALTMDRLWFENRYPYLKTQFVSDIWVREKCDCNVPGSTAHPFKHFKKPSMSVTKGELHGSNSGACAINLAFQRMEEGDNLFLLGFDMCRGPGNEPYWYPPYPWTTPEGATKPGHFRDWVVELQQFHAQFLTHKMNVFNVTCRSKIDAFPKISFSQMFEMIE